MTISLSNRDNVAADSQLTAYPALTGLRGLAAGWVLIYHAWVAAEPRLMLLPVAGTQIDITPIFSSGGVGVDIFFTLSAFLLALPFAHANACGLEGPRTSAYLWRRCLRILPAYYVQLFLVLATALALTGTLPLSGSQLASHLVLWLNLGPQPVAPLVGVWWTLPIEFGFYLLLPLLAPWLRPARILWLLLLAIVATLGYRYAMFAYISERSVGEKVLMLEQLPGRLDQFIVGTFAAVYIANRPDLGRALSRKAGLILAILGTTLLLTLITLAHLNFETYWSGNPLLFVFHLLAAIAVAALIVAACSDRVKDLRVLRSRPLVFLGTVSYSLYLWHQLILMWLARQPWIDLLSPYTLPALLLIGAPAACLVAWVSWRLVELPSLAWGRSAFSRRNG